MPQIYHPLKNKAADNFFLRLRTQFGGRCIAMKETLRHILTVRRQGGSECMAFIADQSPKWEAMHHWTPFLHHPTSFFIGTEKIGKQMDAAIFYVHVTRPARGHYVGQVMPITYTPGQHADYEITDTYARLLEAQNTPAPGTKGKMPHTRKTMTGQRLNMAKPYDKTATTIAAKKVAITTELPHNLIKTI